MSNPTSLSRRVLLLGGLLAGCQPEAAKRRIDVNWHRQALLEGHLAHWLRAAPLPNGALRSQFGRNWQPKPQAAIDLTGHCRLIVSFVAGAEAGGAPRLLEVARAGGDFLLKHFRDPVHGGFFHQVSPEGQMLADRKRCYGQAFALFALAELARLTQDARWREAAQQAWADIGHGLREPGGGFINETDRRFSPPADGARTQNPLMHLFEALLALAESGEAQGQAGARQLGDFVLRRLLQGLPDGGAQIPEWYDPQWKPLATQAAGGYTDLGHQFEWVHLLNRASELGIAPVYAGVADRLLQFALAKGYDEIEGGCFERLQPEGKIERTKGWWQQAECLQALMVAASAGERRELWRRYEQTLELIQQRLVDAQQGGWRPGVQCRDKVCEDEQPDPYHMVRMHRTALRLGAA